VLRVHSALVSSVAFSPDGKNIFTGSADGTAQLWDAAARRPLGNPLPGPADAVAFSPDGKTLATGSGDGTAQLWDVATHHPIGDPLTGHNDAVFSVAFSPDGKNLATGTIDGTVQLWDVSYVVDIVPHLCASAKRSLTPAEWERYAPGPAYQIVCP